MRKSHVTCLVSALVALAAAGAAAAADAALPGFDFTRAADVQGWQATHDISRLAGTPEGLAIEVSGSDPYTFGPPRDFPAGVQLWLRMRIKSEQPGVCQVFYCPQGTGPAEDRSVHIAVPTTDWVERRVPLPPLGPKTWFRIDPPGTGGKAVVAFMKFEPRVLFAEPKWPKPAAPRLGEKAASVTSGDVVVRYGAGGVGDFEVRVAGEPMAVGLAPSLIGYVQAGAVRWVSLADAACEAAAGQGAGGAAPTFVLRDPDGARWRVQRSFKPGGAAGTVDVAVSVTVDKPREVVFLPMLLLAAGAGSFGQEKNQGLLAGLEYLANEPSSSEADIRGPASKRQVPDNVKITAPLMVIQAGDRYVGLAWAPAEGLSAVFDSPDRLFGSGGHVMGVIFPGSDGENRPEGSLMPYGAARLEANKPVVLQARILGGKGASVIPAVQQYVRTAPLPPTPDPGVDWQGYVRLAAGGWLDSKIREGDLYRHAYWPGFGPQPAADAAAWMDYLALCTADTALAERLHTAAAAALARAGPAAYYHSGVSHVRHPVVPLVYGHVAEAVEAARQTARGNLARFGPDGSIPYRASKDKPDYGSTHYEKEANGLTSQVVAVVLEAAAYCGDRDLIAEGIRVLKALDKFSNTVPRGAQTWEVPLHTPDILASANLVKAYTLGYELTGDKHFLEQAQYWAWTGVPLVYLVNPTPGKVGPYSTIAVLGGTNWEAPVWFGQPVQWCGLVYADALYRLAPHDPAGPWGRVADGIAAAGIQHTWKQDDKDRQGLLPDFFHLRAQRPDGPGINPGTVQANAVRLFRQRPMYGFHALPERGITVHAPGAVKAGKVSDDGFEFTVEGWPQGEYYVLVSGLTKAPRVSIGGRETPIEGPHQYLPAGNLILQVSDAPRAGPVGIAIRF